VITSLEIQNNYTKEIIKYLASMMERGLSASSGHSMVNALLFYYQQIEQQKGFELKLPRPKKKKITSCINDGRMLANI
jgi:hypothetical protein